MLEQILIEDLKRFLKDVETFLSITLKKEKLQRETTAKRDALVKDLAGIRGRLSPTQDHEDIEEDTEEYIDVDLPPSSSQEATEDQDELYETPVPDSTQSNDSSQHSDDEKPELFDLDTDPYGDVKVDPIAVSELNASSKQGFMDKKRKEGQFGLQSWQKRYCVLKGNILYYYKKKTDKEQCNQIVLTGYQGREAPDYEKKNKRKDCLFEVVCPAKRSFQFIAPNKQDMQDWIKVIAIASKLGPSSVTPLAKSTPNNSGGTEDNCDDLYDDTGPAEDSGEIYELLDTDTPAPADAEEPDAGEIYEVLPDADSPALEQDPEEYLEEIYDDVESAPQRPPKSEAVSPPQLVNRRPGPQPPSEEKPKIKTFVPRSKATIKNAPSDTQQKPVEVASPPPPVPNRSETPTEAPRSEPWHGDYENIYMGMWDCSADDLDELEFKRGELVHIISKEYDTFNWWIGEKNSKVGLVPKDYLMKAYVM